MIEKIQKTIKRSVKFEGLSLHSGQWVEVSLHPLPENSGIMFRRTDINGDEIKLDINTIHSLNRETAIKKNGIVIRTIEHLLSVLNAFEIDNIMVELNGEELPIGDGSAKIYVEAIKKAGIENLTERAKVLEIQEPVFVRENGRVIVGLPSKDFRITYIVSFDHPAIGTQMFESTITPETYEKEISQARTFGFLSEAEELYKKGLALGGNYENVVVIGDDRVLNGPLRFPNEFARHKALDLIGDLYITGKQIKGHIIAVKAGHKLHMEFVKKLVENFQK